MMKGLGELHHYRTRPISHSNPEVNDTDTPILTPVRYDMAWHQDHAPTTTKIVRLIKKLKWFLFLFLIFVAVAFYYKMGRSEKTSKTDMIIEIWSQNTSTTDTHIDDEIYMKALRKSDIPLLKAVTKLTLTGLKDADAEETYQKIVTKPLQGVCKVLKRIGGIWKKKFKAVDGDKFVCFDDTRIFESRNNCLIYSFGISNDWTFEDQMDAFGCSVFAFDPTVTFPRKRGNGIIFEKLGVAAKDAINRSTVNVSTLADILNKNNHSHSVINYIKIDIEGAELEGMDDWLSSGALDNVKQFALEIHTIGGSGAQFKNYIKTLQDLYRAGFRIVSYEPNTAMGRSNTTFYTMFEVVFMKDTKWKYLDT